MALVDRSSMSCPGADLHVLLMPIGWLAGRWADWPPSGPWSLEAIRGHQAGKGERHDARDFS
jgi:hypothetical protein